LRGGNFRTKAYTVTFLAVAFWLVWCLDPLLNNKPERFQAAGSIMVAWGIYRFGKERLTREKILNSANAGAIISAINRLSAAQSFHESLAENTANMHSLNHYKLMKQLRVKSQHIDDIDSAIEELEARLSDRTKHDELYDKFVSLHNDVTDAVDEKSVARNRHEPWVGYLASLELYFVIFGTLQWGYGNFWVETLHQGLIPYFVN
jgi:hypothetical protein